MTGFVVNQALIQGATGGSISQTQTFTNVPLAGDLIWAQAMTNTPASTISIADTFGDAGVWNLITGPTNDSLGAVRTATYWKIVGTPGGGGKTVTATFGTSGSSQLLVGSWTPPAGTVVIDGTPLEGTAHTSGSVPPGTITTTSDNGLVVGSIATNGAAATIGSWGTQQLAILYTYNNSIGTAITTSAGTVTPSWALVGTDYYIAEAVAFGISGGGGGPSPMYYTRKQFYPV